VRHAHGYIVQDARPTSGSSGSRAWTLALLVAWIAAAGAQARTRFKQRLDRLADGGALGCANPRTTAAPGWRRLTVGGRPAPYSAERIGMLAMLCIVVVFRDPLAGRLDVVRAGRTRCVRAAVRGVAGRARTARGRRDGGTGGTRSRSRRWAPRSAAARPARANPGSAASAPRSGLWLPDVA